MSLNSLQDDMSRRAASMAAMAKGARNPEQIQAIQKSLIAGVQSGAIKAYVGIPLIQELTNKLSEVKAKMAQSVAGAGMSQPPQGQQAPQPPIAQQIMAQAAQADQSRGVETLTSNLPESYTGGGIIAFEDGGKVERYQNTGFTGMGNVSTPYSATNPNVAMNEFLKRLNLSPAQFANASPEAQKNILDMFRSVSEAPKPMATPTVTPTASATAPATSGPYRAGQAVGQAVRGSTSGAGNLLSRGLIGTIGGPATGGVAALLTPSPLGDDQAVLAALRGEGYQGQPYDVLSARKILEAAGMDPNKAPIKSVTPAATPSNPATTTGQEKPPAPAAPANIGFKMPTLQTYTPTTATLPERTAPVLTDLDAITKKLPEETKTAVEAKVTEVQNKLEEMDRPGFESREERLGKREAGLERENAISRALTGIKTGLRVAGSKERTLAGALGNEGSQGIEDLIRGEAANRAAKDKLEDYRDNLEQQKVASKKGNYQAAQAAGERAADNLYKYTNLNLNAASAGNSQALQRQQIEQTGDIGKAGVLNQGEQLKLSAIDQQNRNQLGIAQLQATTASANAQLQLGRERLGILKDQIAAGNERARATLVQAENKAASTWQSSPQYQQAQAQAKKMAPIEAQRFMQNSWLQYKENMLPSLMGGGGANIPSFNDMYKATE
jgi:hypothetical protein